MAQPKEKYVITFSKDENGQEMHYRFMLTLSKKLNEKLDNESTVRSRLMESFSKIVGIDGIGVGGSWYSIEMIIARTFDADEVIQEIKKALDEEVLSEIIRPKLVV